MIKTAIFVEGQTELIFVREMLLKVFEANDISFRCWKLLYDDDDNFFPADYNYPNEVAAFYFEIVQVGNDEAVPSQIIKKERLYWNKGFFRIIGLRDMYSPRYLKVVKNRRISHELNQKTIALNRDQMTERAVRMEAIHFHFAIMEVEAWLLGLKDLFNRLSENLSLETIRQHLSFDLNAVDPETSFIHPANQIKQIMQLIEQDYDKHGHEVGSLMGLTSREDFLDLRDSGKCASFASFFASLPSEADFLAATL